jgi:streptogramin lyase
MNKVNLKVSTCSVAVLVVVALGPAVGRSVARETATLRLRDRLISVAAPQVSATSEPGFVKAHLAVTLANAGRKSLAASASDFALSAQGDIFSAEAWNAGRGQVNIRPSHSRVFRLTFALPRAAMKQAALIYRAADTGASGSVPVSRSARVAHSADASSPAQPTIKTFYAPGGVGEPWDTAMDRSGNVWFAEPGCDFAPTCSANAGPGQIGEINASSHAVVFYQLPSISGNQPIFLTFDDAGNLWFTTPNNSMIGEFDPSTGQFVGQWPVTAGTGPWDLTFARGKLWYTERLASAVGSFDPSTHAYGDFQTPTANSNPYGIAAHGGLIWFTENNSSVDRIAVLDTAKNNAISEYPIVQPVSGTPHLIAIDANGNPWWTEGWSNTIATLDPAAATPGRCGTTSGTCNGIQRFHAPAPTACAGSGSHTSGIAFQDSAELVWFDNSLTAQVGSFSPSSHAFAMNTLSSCSAHPHDGLSLDGLGNVWFDEEFANAIGELIPPAPAAAPSVVTGSSSAVGTTSAAVSGSVNPNGQATTYHFEYGTSTSYGSQAPAPPDPGAGSGTTSQPVSANLTDLSPSATYHYRLVATNASGTQLGSDGTFMTATTPATITAFGDGGISPDPGPNPGPNPGPTGTFATGVIEALHAMIRWAPPSIRTLLKSGRTSVRFAAPAAGTLTVVWSAPNGRAAGAAAKRVIVAKGTKTVSTAGAAGVRVKLTPAGRRLLKGARTRLKISASATFRTTAGTSATSKATLRLRPR